MSLIWDINLLIAGLFKIALAPFEGLAPFWGLALISFITGGLMVVIFKFVSNQEGIRRSKGRVRAHFLEVWIFKHDFKVVMGAIGRVLKANLSYMRYAVTPLLVMIFPVILIMAHLNLFYGFSPLKPGTTALLTVKFSGPAAAMDTSLTADADGNIIIDGNPVRTPFKNEAVWRIKGKSAGKGEVRIKWSGGAIEKTVVVGGGKTVSLSAERSPEGSLTAALLNPSEKPLGKETGVEKITVAYPERSINALGMEMHWLIVFFVLSIAAGFALKGVFGVEI